MHNKAVLLLMLTLVFCASVAAADVLVVTDEERIEEFSDCLRGTLSASKIDRALGFVDTSAQAIHVRAGAQRWTFDDEDAELRAFVRQELRPVMGRDHSLIQQTVEVEDDHARLALRVRSGREIVDTVFGFRRVADRWLVQQVQVH